MSKSRQQLEQDFEAAKRASTGQLLIRTARLFNDRAVAQGRTLRGIRLRPAHTALFPHLSLEGTRMTTLAEKLGITKQAVGQIVAELESAGVLCLVPDPDDGRAKRVRFTSDGYDALLAGFDALHAIEEDLATELGRPLLERLNRDLGEILAVFEENN